MKIDFILTLLMQAAVLLAVLRSRRAIIMTIQELEVEIGNLSDQLTKALTEILEQIQTLGNVPQSLIDKVTVARATAQSLDDLNPDQP